MECFSLEMGQGVILLTLSAFLQIICIAALDGRSIVVGFEYLRSHCSPARVVSTHPFMDLYEDILCLLLGDAFQ